VTSCGESHLGHAPAQGRGRVDHVVDKVEDWRDTCTGLVARKLCATHVGLVVEP
jgi:hypothetical protein